MPVDYSVDLGLTFEDIEFPAVDGKTLRGWFVAARETSSVAVVPVHGDGSDRRDFLRQLPIFHDAGHPVLLFDCRNHGASDGDGDGVTLRVQESRDVSSAVQFLKAKRGFARVVAVGGSQGAASAILAAGNDSQIDGVVAIAPFGNLGDLIGAAAGLYGLPRWLAALTVRTAAWRLNADSVETPLDGIARISPQPIMLIHGTHDLLIPFRASQVLFDHAGPPKSLWLAPDASHIDISYKCPEEYKRRIDEFLQTYFPLAPLASDKPCLCSFTLPAMSRIV